MRSLGRVATTMTQNLITISHSKGKRRFYIFKYASRKPGIWAAKNPDKIGAFAEHIFFMFLFWRKRWDSNPRAREGYLISSQARYDHFDTLPYSQQIVFYQTKSDLSNNICNIRSNMLKYFPKEGWGYAFVQRLSAKMQC